MRLEPMRFKSFTWPHNPRTYHIAFQRQVAAHKIPFGNYCLQDLGLSYRTLEGEGELVGTGAYDTFRELADLFYEGGPGVLVHPVWQTASAYFVRLTVVEEPLPDYVRYQFAFQEDYAGIRTGLRRLPEEGTARGSGTVCRVGQGDTLWAIAARYGLTLTALLAANPAIKNPNLVAVGQQVVIPE